VASKILSALDEPLTVDLASLRVGASGAPLGPWRHGL
jgi:hypothetical protein